MLIDHEHEDVVALCHQLTGARCAPVAGVVWFGMVSFLAPGTPAWRNSLRTMGRLGLALLGNLVPGGRQTRVYSIEGLARRHPDWYREDLATLLSLAVDGTVVPRPSVVHTLDGAPAALAALATRATTGKQVIAVSPVP